jgi:oligosaccharide repeat unit polymerase
LVHGNFSLLILLLSGLFLFLAYILVKNILGNMKLPFIALFFYFKYIMLVFIGAVVLNIIYINYYYEIGVYNNKFLLFNVWAYASAGLFLIPIGMLVSNTMLRYRPKKELRYFHNINLNIKSIDYKNNIIFLLYILLFSTSLLMLLIYRIKIGGTLPIEHVFSGLDARALAALRSDASNNFKGRYWLYMLFIKELPLILLVITFYLKDYAKKYKYLFYIILLYSMFVSIMDFQKAPILKIITLLLLVKIFKDGYINKRIFIIVGSLSVALVLLMYIFFMGASDKSFLELLSLPLSRIFIGNIEPFYWWQLFQEHNGYIYGTSFPNPGGIFPFEWRKITVEINNFAHPELVSMGIVGSMPTVFFASWFINFGMIMALFSMLFFGFLIQTIDIILIRKLNKNKNIYYMVMMIVLMFYFGQFAERSFEGLIFDPSFYMPILLLLFLYISRNSLKIKTR